MRIASVDLRNEAIAEVRRLNSARALLRDGDEAARSRLEGDATWLVVATRTKLRQSLGRRACLLWRVTLEEATGGRPVASRLVPVLVEITRPADRRSSKWVEHFLREADARLRARVEAGSESWRAEVVREVNTFASARLGRELGYKAPAQPEVNSQPGLFDRRAERTREASTAAAAESEQATSRRLRTIRAAADIVPLPARLLLVVVP